MISTAIASSYADLARLYADRDVLAATATVREHSLRLVRARTDHGLASDADLAQAEAGPPAARADLAATDEALALVLNRLARSEEHTSELQSLIRTTSAAFCLK